MRNDPRKNKRPEATVRECSVCGNLVYAHMEENVAIFDETGMCGVCATGEADVYFDEL